MSQAWREEHYCDVGEKSVAAYNRACAIFEPLHKKKFRNIKTADFQAVIDRHMEKSNSAVSKYKLLASQMSEWAIREELITTNFASFIRVPEKSKKEKEIFSDDDIEKLEEEGVKRRK